MSADQGNLELEIKITNFSVEINPVARTDNIRGFVVWVFHTDVGIWKLKGGTIRQKAFGRNENLLLTYDPPAIGRNFTKVIFIDNKELYKKLCNYSIDEYCKLTGEIRNDIAMDETINPDDLPI